jgi:hypothetical protein
MLLQEERGNILAIRKVMILSASNMSENYAHINSIYLSLGNDSVIF